MTFFALTMKGEIIKCREGFHVLTYAQPADYQWIKFSIGDDIPSSAVVGGYWRDGTPLYIICVKHQHLHGNQGITT